MTPLVDHIDWQSRPAARVFSPNHCGESLPISDDFFSDHWSGKPLTCLKCSVSFDRWKLTVESIMRNHMRSDAYVFISGKSTSFNFRLQPNKSFQYSLQDLGIPSDSKVVYVNYTPNAGGLFPAEFTGNLALTSERFDPVTVVGGKLGQSSDIASETEVCCSITYLPGGVDAVDFQLQEAVDHYCHNQFANCIIPSHTAFEISLSRLVQTYLLPAVKKESVEKFSRIAFEHKLNVMLPLIAHAMKVETMHDEILGSIKQLQKMRNGLAHKGAPTHSFDASEMAKLISGSLFGVSYTRYLLGMLPNSVVIE